MTSLVLMFLVFLLGLSYSRPDVIIKQIKEINKNEAASCHTPHDLNNLFTSACEKVVYNESLCYDAWNAFTSGFGYKDPKTITKEDYKQYFEVLPVTGTPNTSVYWSGVPSVVEEISKHPNISSSFNEGSADIVNIMTEQFNVTCWCGNKTAIIDTVNACPAEPTVAFWEAFSYHFGQSGRDVVFWIGDGDRKGGAYQNTSFFTTIEFPNLTYPRVVELVAIDIYECNKTMVESCGEGTLKLLESEAVEKYGNNGYKCFDVCGNALDIKEVQVLANKTLQVIREVQHKLL